MTGTKAECRRHHLAARRGIDETTRRAHSAAVAARVRALPMLAGARALLTYRPMGAEIDPGGVSASAAAAGLVVYTAASADGPIVWTRSAPGAGAALGEAGIAATGEGPLVVLVPGVAFDEAGWRLGRGGGYYDRSLAALRAAGPLCAVGLAYDLQVVGRLPRDGWDQPVDIIVTERRLIVAGGADAAVGEGRGV